MCGEIETTSPLLFVPCLFAEPPGLQFNILSPPPWLPLVVQPQNLWTLLQVRLPGPVILSIDFAPESGECLLDQVILFFAYSRTVGWLHPQARQGASKLCPCLGEWPPLRLGTDPYGFGSLLTGDGLTRALALLWKQQGGTASDLSQPEAAMEV